MEAYKYIFIDKSFMQLCLNFYSYFLYVSYVFDERLSQQHKKITYLLLHFKCCLLVLIQSNFIIHYQYFVCFPLRIVKYSDMFFKIKFSLVWFWGMKALN